MSLHLRFFTAIDRLPDLNTPVLATSLGRQWPQFLQRGWVTDEGFLTHVMVPFLDSECEVEIEADPDAGCYRYRSPQCGRIVMQPLSEVALCAIQIEPWLADLALLIGIEQQHRTRHTSGMSHHLWHLGNLRVAKTHDFAPVFVARAWARAPGAHTFSILADAVWPGRGVVLQVCRRHDVLPRGHEIRALDEFIYELDGQDVFDTNAFNSVLCSYASSSSMSEPIQFFQGNRLKLPHFPVSRELSVTRAKIIRLMWGFEDTAAPELSWAEVNGIANTGYQSFDDAFGGKIQREEVIEKLAERGKYRVRRKP